MRTKNVATVSAVVFGLTAALMSGTALSQATNQDPAQQPIPEETQTGTQAQGEMGTQTEGDATMQAQDETETPIEDDATTQAQDGTATEMEGETGMQAQDGTGTEMEGDAGMQAQDGTGTEGDAMDPETGVAEDADPLETETGTGTGMAADDGLPRRSVADSAEPYTGEVLAGITADELIGMNVTDAAGESVGSVTDLLFGAEDQVDHAIIDVGGFLGFGAKSVAIPLEELTIAEDEEVVLNTTREELDAMPEWTRGEEGWMSN